MKFNIEIDATPQEVRNLLGLPEVEALQQEIVASMREKMLASLDEQNPAELMKAFMPDAEQFKSLDALQKSFWQAFAQGGKSTDTGNEDR